MSIDSLVLTARIANYVRAEIALNEFLTGRRLTIKPPAMYQLAFEDADKERDAALRELELALSE